MRESEKDSNKNEKSGKETATNIHDTEHERQTERHGNAFERHHLHILSPEGLPSNPAKKRPVSI